MSMQSNNRKRGQKHQLRVLSIIQEGVGLTAEDARVPIGSETGEDIKISRRARPRWPYATEVKYAKVVSVASWLRQAIQHTKAPTLYSVLKGKVVKHAPIPLVVFRLPGTRVDWCLLPFRRLIELQRKVNEKDD